MVARCRSATCRTRRSKKSSNISRRWTASRSKSSSDKDKSPPGLACFVLRSARDQGRFCNAEDSCHRQSEGWTVTPTPKACGKVDPRVTDGLAVRTKPQAPRTLRYGLASSFSAGVSCGSHGVLTVTHLRKIMLEELQRRNY